MIAVIKTGGKQYVVSPGEKIVIEKIDAKLGDKFRFEEVLFFEDDKGEFLLGTPYLDGVKVEGKVINEGLGEKKRVFKYKPKKRYKVKKGHRQPFMEVEIEEVKLESKTSSKKTTKEKATKEKETPETKKPLAKKKKVTKKEEEN